MMNRAAIISFVATLVLVSACVSSTTGDPRTESSNAEASQNYYQLGARYLRNGKYEFARDRLERAIELNPGNAIAHSTLALAYVQLDNLRLAREHYDQAVKLAPEDIDIRNSYAVFLCQQRRFDEARQQFDRTMNLPKNDDPEILLTNAGVCMVQKPDLELAETYFREALKHKSSYGEALLQLALLKRNAGDNLAARAFVQRFLASNPATPEILYLAMQVERDNGDDQASGEYALRILQEFPKSMQASRVRDGR